jgi:predicted metal-dependent phosphoesterase TrpH/glycosyltransferase involved in cell wall biosynthesis
VGLQLVAYPRFVADERFSIAQVTPYAWERQHEVNHFVSRLSDQLVARGHRVVVICPSDSRELVRRSRELIRDCAGDPQKVFADESVRVLAVGQNLPFPPKKRGGTLALPMDVSKTIEQVLQAVPFDFVHVHEPFAPSASSVALRQSRALNIGTFHAPAERILSTQVARRFVELMFGRLDARTTSFQTTKDLVNRFFPGDYRVIWPGADAVERSQRDEAVPELLFVAEEERAALRVFLRALRRLSRDPDWHATIWSRSSIAGGIGISKAVRNRLSFRGPSDGPESAQMAAADIALALSGGIAPAPQVVLRALASGAVPVAARLPEYEELLSEGSLGMLFEPGDLQTLAAQLERLITDTDLRDQFKHKIRAHSESLSWAHTAKRFEDLYLDVAARRHTPTDERLKQKLIQRPLVSVDLHMHTDHSHDCATPVDVLLETAKKRGLQAVAITDHNEISGALEARQKADGIKVIVGEEVKTADQGEVIGLFIEEHIPRGMSLEDTIAEIRRQGGIVYVPHPFDRLHSVPDYEHLLKVVELIDCIEVYNSRVTVSSFNEEAARFAAKYRIAAGAGSDSHVAQGLGAVKIRMRDFSGPQEFVASLRDADIVRKRQSLLYVQALKFMQTRGGRSSRSKRASVRATEAEPTNGGKK